MALAGKLESGRNLRHELWERERSDGIREEGLADGRGCTGPPALRKVALMTEHGNRKLKMSLYKTLMVTLMVKYSERPPKAVFLSRLSQITCKKCQLKTPKKSRLVGDSLKMAARVAGVGGLSGRPGAERDAEWLILRTSEGTADYRAGR